MWCLNSRQQAACQMCEGQAHRSHLLDRSGKLSALEITFWYGKGFDLAAYAVAAGQAGGGS